MAADLHQAIQKYITDEIRLARSDISASAKSREWFLTRIANVIAARTSEPVLLPADPFLRFGSYFKRTQVRDVDEFDILVKIDSNTGMFSRGGKQVGTGQGSASPNHKYDKKYFKSDDSGISPAKMLNWLKSVVKEVTDAFDGEAPERNGQAITAIIKSQNLKIDLVPGGVFKKDSDGTVFYNIPKGDKDGGWITTSPELDIKRVDDAAKGRIDFRNVIRILKRIRDTYNFANVSSFAVETVVINFIVANTWSNVDISTNLIGVLSALSSVFRQGQLDDPFESGSNLLDGVDSLSWYADRIDKIIAELQSVSTYIEDQDACYARIRKALENE